MNHTPTPWNEPHAGSIRAKDGRMVADCFHLLPSHINTVDHADEGMANAARIVACVNACEGIADPAEAIEEARKALDMAYVQLAESIYGADQAIARHLSSAIAKLTKRA